MGRATVPEDVFSYLHHPASPAKHNYFMARHAADWDKTLQQVADLPCEQIYLTRTGSRANQPNKCAAVVPVPDGFASRVQQSHRMGYTALNTDQYQQDYPRSYNSRANSEPALLKPLLEELPSLIQLMRDTLGDRRHATVMVANAGVLDLLLNFVCSAEAAGIDLASVVVFVGDPQTVRQVQRMGISAVHAPALGAMPSKAAGSYLDGTFSRMMWFKAAAVYVTLMAGYEVLFQDVDLVWLLDPMRFFETQTHYDLFFMDDGARTPRYTPFFVNSGFYFVKHNARTVYLFESLMKAAAAEIGQTHSHQSVLIRHIAEAAHLFSVRVFVLDMDQFPSGQAYHENKPFVRQVQARGLRPFVFHMCWTDNRENKLVYFKDVGLWLVSETQPACFVAQLSAAPSADAPRADAPRADLRGRCCQRSRYWPPPTDADFAAALNMTAAKQAAARKKRAEELRRDLPFWRREEQAAQQWRRSHAAPVAVASDASGLRTVADDAQADDKLEEDGDLSRRKRDKQRAQLATTPAERPLTRDEDVEGYGADVPLETFDGDAAAAIDDDNNNDDDNDDDDDAADADDGDDDDDDDGDDDDDDAPRR